jgi:pimeloyl-ACP methyl ester carboxylesterase
MTADRSVRLAAGPIHYREAGSGPPIVFVHGLLVHGGLWRKVVPELSGEFRCIVPDWPFGSHPEPMNPDADLSPPGAARIVADFLAALELDEVTLVGNDSGGAISQIVAVRHPQRIARLGLLSCDCYEVFPPRLFAYLKLSAQVPGLIGPLLAGLRLRALRDSPLAFGWAVKHRLDAEVSAGYVRPALSDRAVRRDAAKFVRGMSPAHTLDAATRFGEVRAPVLVAWGAEDRFFPWSLAERLAAAFPNSRLERIEDARTFVPEDQPRRTAELIASLAREPVGAPA